CSAVVGDVAGGIDAGEGEAMFKWACLGVATLFLGFVAWALNDIRLEVRRTSQTINTAGQTLNDKLPEIMDSTHKASTALGEDVPEIAQKSRAFAETAAEVAQDLRRLKETVARLKADRPPDLVDYADSLLDAIEASGAEVSTKPLLGGLGGKKPAI